MMPVKDLLAGECGGANPLLRASEHLTRTTGLDQRLVSRVHVEVCRICSLSSFLVRMFSSLFECFLPCTNISSLARRK